MAVTFSPTAPIVDEEVTISQTMTVGGTTVTLAASQATLTALPAESALELGLLVDDAGEPALTFTPDVPGVYSWSVVAFREQTIPPAFGSDTAESLVVASATETATIAVGVELSLPIVTTNGHEVDLLLTLHNDTVTSAELANPTTEKARICEQHSTVVTKLAALVGVASASLGPALITKVGDLGTKFDAHGRQATVHPASDTINRHQEGLPYTIEQAAEKLNKLRSVMLAHFLNASTSGIVWHTADDTKNVPVSPPAASLPQVMQLYADLAWRCYERHRVLTASPAAHSNADNTNTMGTIDKLSDAIVAVLDFLADETPTAPATENAGQSQLESLYGFAKVA